MNLIFFLFLTSMLLFSTFYKHLLLTLLSLEFMIINLSLLTYNILIFLNFNIYFMSFMYTIMVCESILGLSILVFMVRKLGNDYMNILKILKF